MSLSAFREYGTVAALQQFLTEKGIIIMPSKDDK
jgi:hypothetical protein